MATKGHHPSTTKHASSAGGEKSRAAPAQKAAESEPRTKVGEAAQEVRDKLDPTAMKAELSALRDSLKEELKQELSQLRETTGDVVSGAQRSVERTGESVAELIRQNPVPMAMTGFGVAWMLVDGITGRGRRAGVSRGDRRIGDDVEVEIEVEGTRRTGDGGRIAESIQRRGTDLRKRASEIAQQAGSSYDSFKRNAGERVTRITRDVQERGKQIGSTVGEKYEANPWLIGAAAVTAGAIAGLAAPSTRREDAMLGSARDGLVETAQELANKALDKVQSAAKRVEDTAAQISGSSKRGA